MSNGNKIPESKVYFIWCVYYLDIEKVPETQVERNGNSIPDIIPKQGIAALLFRNTILATTFLMCTRFRDICKYQVSRPSLLTFN